MWDEERHRSLSGWRFYGKHVDVIAVGDSDNVRSEGLYGVNVSLQGLSLHSLLSPSVLAVAPAPGCAPSSFLSHLLLCRRRSGPVHRHRPGENGWSRPVFRWPRSKYPQPRLFSFLALGPDDGCCPSQKTVLYIRACLTSVGVISSMSTTMG